MSALAQGLLAAVPRTLQAGRPQYFSVDGDVALTVGRLIKEDPRVTGEVLAIDGITLRNFDFVDLGRIRMPAMTAGYH